MFGSHEARRAALYRQLGALETAGIPLGTAVNKVLDGQLERVGKLLDEGEDPGNAWEKAGFASLDVALVKAGAKGGMLAATFKDLEQIHQERAAAARRLTVTLAYPVGLIHLAVLLPNLHLLLKSGLLGYAKATVVPLFTAWALLAAAIFLGRAARKTAPALVDNLLASIPPFGKLLQKQAIAHGLHVLGALYRAGVPVRDAVDAARESANLHPVSMAFARIGQRLDAGMTIGDAFLKEDALPDEVREAASTGSLTGQLDETLAGAEHRLVEEAKMRLQLILTATPVVIFLIVAAYVGWTVISFYVDYFNKISDIK
jgi:type II secretory pathway component PulF